MKLHHNIIFLLALLNIHFSAESQSLKTYSGNFSGGTATYQYYENEKFERIFHGSFLFKFPDYTIKGQYKNNLKDGIWTSEHDTPYEFTKLTGTFINGKLEENWSYLGYVKNNKTKKLNLCKEVNVTFLHNNFTGKYSLKQSEFIRYDETSKIIIDGYFNNDGLMDSTWTVKYTKDHYDYETFLKYKSGILHNSFSRNLSNGEFEERFDSLNFVTLFQHNYDTLKNISKVNDNYYSKKIHRDSSVIRTTDQFEFDEPISFNIHDRGSLLSSRTEAFDLIINYLFYDFFDNSLFILTKGNCIVITYPECILSKRDDYKRILIERENRRKIEEDKRIAEEKDRIKREAAKALRLRFDSLVLNGDKLFEEKKFKTALTEYNSAKSLGVINNVINSKLINTQREIDKIKKQQNFRKVTYANALKKIDQINSEMKSLMVSLEEIKKKYAKNYELCMNLLSADFSSSISSINTLLSENSINGEINEDAWNETDQTALDNVLKLKKEIEDYELFHKAVQYAFNHDNQQLKNLQLTSDLNTIISSFNLYGFKLRLISSN